MSGKTVRIIFQFVLSVLIVISSGGATTSAQSSDIQMEYELAEPVMIGPIEADPVEPTLSDMVAIASQRQVMVEEISPMSVACWQKSYTLDHSNYWVRLTMHWCYDISTGISSSIWGYGTYGVKGNAGGALTVFKSTTGTSCGPYYVAPHAAQCHQQWHFQFLQSGYVSKNYYPWITITGSRYGYIVVSYQY